MGNKCLNCENFGKLGWQLEWSCLMVFLHVCCRVVAQAPTVAGGSSHHTWTLARQLWGWRVEATVQYSTVQYSSHHTWTLARQLWGWRLLIRVFMMILLYFYLLYIELYETQTLKMCSFSLFLWATLILTLHKILNQDLDHHDKWHSISLLWYSIVKFCVQKKTIFFPRVSPLNIFQKYYNFWKLAFLGFSTF